MVKYLFSILILCTISFQARPDTVSDGHAPNIKYSRAQLKDLYPNLSDDDFAAKLDGAKNKFHFLRTFVPLYYQLIKDYPAPLITEKNLLAPKGWCVGDAHPENFGVLVDDLGQPVFTMNDPDDAGPCPLFADVLRFFVAVRLYDKDIDSTELVSAYLDSLSGQSVKFSAMTEDLAKKARGKIDPSDKVLDGNGNIKRDDGIIDVTADQKRALQNSVTQLYGVNAEILDAISMKKASGGSGGLTRYRALVSFPSVGFEISRRIQLLEFKSVQAPGILPLLAGTLPDFNERFRHTLELEEGPNISSLFDTTMILGAQMLVRPRRAGNLGIVLDDLKKNETIPVLKDEVGILARIHVRSADDLQAFNKTLQSLSPKDWNQLISYYADLMDQVFNQVR